MRFPAYTWRRRSVVLNAGLFFIYAATESTWALVAIFMLTPAIGVELWWRKEAEFWQEQHDAQLKLSLEMLDALRRAAGR